MFALAIYIGIYSYLIFLLGAVGLIYKPLVIIVTLIFFLFLIIFYRQRFQPPLKELNIKILSASIRKNRLFSFMVLIIFVQALVNLVGVLGPEISFDSLWYHLTLPKLYILNHGLFFHLGAKMVYSVMPKLIEMLYASAMILTNDSFAKLIHFSFGILILIAIYKISRKFVSKEFSILAAAVFYANLVVGWESITAYVDLARGFYELLAIWGFINWFETKQKKWLIISAVVLGLAVTVKLVAAFSLLIFLALFVYKKFMQNEQWLSVIKNYLIFFILTFIVPLPWFIFSYLKTGNPFYPYLSNVGAGSSATFKFISFPNVLSFPSDAYNFFLGLNDPISPVYLIVLPLVIVMLKRFDLRAKFLIIYASIALAIWYLTEQVWGGRFILPYLPVFSILTAFIIAKVQMKRLRIFLIITVIFISLISIGYRGIANAKFLPVVLGKESKAEFLTKYLNFSFGDFYDTDNYFRNHLTKNDTVLLFGFGKLYYIGFNFIDSSWVKKGDRFNYIAVQDGIMPERFSDWKEIYYNKLTKVKLYTKEGQICVY
jgi:4-amino-4-deoxy-L-arabinose transferase-like glycosyltransferase